MGKHIIETKYDLGDTIMRHGESGKVVRIDIVIDQVASDTHNAHIAYHANVETTSGYVVKVIQESEL